MKEITIVINKTGRVVAAFSEYIQAMDYTDDHEGRENYSLEKVFVDLHCKEPNP